MCALTCGTRNALPQVHVLEDSSDGLWVLTPRPGAYVVATAAAAPTATSVGGGVAHSGADAGTHAGAAPPLLPAPTHGAPPPSVRRSRRA